MNVRADDIRALVDDLAIPGAALYVVAPNLGLDEGVAAGVRDVASLEPLGVDTPLRIASNTKTYVALALLRLCRTRGVALSSPVRRVFPVGLLQLLEPVYDVDSITIQHLLTHTSGMRCHTDDPSFVTEIVEDSQRHWTREEQVARAIRLGAPHGAPGEFAYYSDTGYVLLGALVEELSGEPLGPALRAVLGFETLRLRSTWYEELEQPAVDVARGRQYVGEQDFTDWDPSMDLYGGGGLVSTVRDLARFYSALPSQPEFSDMTLTVVAPESTPLRAGLFEQTLNGSRVFGHSGYWGTVAQVVPREQVTVAAAVTQRDAAKRLHERVNVLTEELVGQVKGRRP